MKRSIGFTLALLSALAFARPAAANEIYAFPNPARQVPAVTFHADVAGAHGVELLVFNVAGELVHEGRLSGNNEYRWNLSDVSPGTYTLIVRAGKGGASSIVARKHFTVLQ